jgi:hypothetical protein
MSDEETQCEDPPYFKFWMLIIATLILGWLIGTNLLYHLFSKFLGI